MAKHTTGPRGRSRKRRPAAQRAQQSHLPSRPTARASQRNPGRLAELQTVGERPAPPWHPLPLSELVILVGVIGAVVALTRGEGTNGPPGPTLVASIVAVAIGTVEVTAREHLSGYRSHTVMLALLPTIAFHSIVVLLVATFAQVPRWLNAGLLLLDAALFAVLFKLLRARFADARRERTFAGGR